MLSVVPLRPGDCPSFYRPRRRKFTSVPHCFIYVWRHGVQCRGVDGRPGESCFWRDVMACPVSVQEPLRRWRCRGRSFGGHPHADLMVPLTRGRTRHSSGRGNVLSPRTSTASRMALQCPGWRHGGGDGRTGLMVTEVTSPAGLTSRGSPGQVWKGARPPFEGSTVLFRGRGASAVREWAAQCHGTAAGHAAQCRIVAGMASLGELAEQRWGVIPRRVRGVAWIRL
jgi:hypothetical protein